MIFAVDTNVLVYRADRSFPAKRARAAELLDRGTADGTLRVPYQALVEFVPAVTRPRRDGSGPILPLAEARRQVEEWLDIAHVLYPDEEMLRTAVLGAAAYQISWFDALMWACAEHYAVPTLYSEDFTPGRKYGHTRVVNPFA